MPGTPSAIVIVDATAQLTASLGGYFSAIAQVSGGLVGLVFVALTFNIRALGLRGNPALRALAQQTLSDFLLVLVLSLFMLVPAMPRSNLAFLLIVLGTVGILRACRSLLIVRRTAGTSAPRGLLLQRFGLSILGNLGVLAPGLILLQPVSDLPLSGTTHVSIIGSLLVSAPIILLLSGCRTAWLLVLHQAD